MSKRLRAALRKGDEWEIRQAAGDVLRAEGYLSGSDTTGGTLAKAIVQFQHDNGVKPDGVLNKETLAVMQMPLCGNVSLLLFDAGDGAWPHRNLTFSFMNDCPGLSPAAMRAATAAAFAEWARVTTLTFSEAATANIKIGWFVGDHGDGAAFLRFDGKGGEFGHGFGPSSPFKRGEVHMDGAENWTVGAFQTGNTDLQTVVLHEIGHALGIIDHLPDRNAVMFRRFPLDHTKRILTAADVVAIRALYP